MRTNIASPNEKSALKNKDPRDVYVASDSVNVTQSSTVDSMQLTPVLQKKQAEVQLESSALLKKDISANDQQTQNIDSEQPKVTIISDT